MTRATEQDLIALFTRAPLELSALVVNGALKMPLYIVITDGNDDLISEFEVSHGVAGKVRLCPAKSLESFVFPITYAAADGNGNEWELAFTEEIANELRRRVS